MHKTFSQLGRSVPKALRHHVEPATPSHSIVLLPLGTSSCLMMGSRIPANPENLTYRRRTIYCYRSRMVCRSSFELPWPHHARIVRNLSADDRKLYQNARRTASSGLGQARPGTGSQRLTFLIYIQASITHSLSDLLAAWKKQHRLTGDCHEQVIPEPIVGTILCDPRPRVSLGRV